MPFKPGNFRFRLQSGGVGRWGGHQCIGYRAETEEGKREVMHLLEEVEKRLSIPFHITCGAWRSGGTGEGCPDTTSFLGITTSQVIHCFSIEAVKCLWDLLGPCTLSTSLACM